MAKEHQFWFNEDDRPILDEDENKDSYISDAIILLNAIEKAGLKPPLTKFCPVFSPKNTFGRKKKKMAQAKNETVNYKAHTFEIHSDKKGNPYLKKVERPRNIREEGRGRWMPIGRVTDLYIERVW